MHKTYFKLLVLSLVVIMIATLTACSNISTELENLEIKIDGKVYDYGNLVPDDFIENGWEFRETNMDASYSGDVFIQKDGKELGLRVAYNTAVPVRQKQVQHIYETADNYDNDYQPIIIYPGGVTLRNSPEDIIKKYGEAESYEGSKTYRRLNYEINDKYIYFHIDWAGESVDSYTGEYRSTGFDTIAFNSEPEPYPMNDEPYDPDNLPVNDNPEEMV